MPRLCLTTRLSLPLLLLLLLLAVPSLVDAQWTRLWEYIPSSSRAPSQQAQPLKRAAHSLAVFRDSLYVFGGIGDTSDEDDHEFDDAWRFDLVNEQWHHIMGDRAAPAGAAPPHRFHHSTAVHANATVNEMVVFGGLSITQTLTPGAQAPEMNITQFNDVWRLSLTPEGQETWRADAATSGSASSSSSSSADNATSVPAARSEAGAVVHDGQLYVYGGIAYDDAVDASPVDFGDLWRYDLSACTWALLTPSDGIAPSARFSHSFSAFTDAAGETFLLVFSGRHLELPSWSLLSDTWLFSLSTLKWSRAVAPLPVPRAYTSVVATGGTTPKFWFFGGYFRAKQSANGYVYDDVVSGAFDMGEPTSASVTATPRVQFSHAVLGPSDAVPPLRYNHRAALWKDAMVVHGGSYQSQRGDVWAFNLTSAVLRQDAAAALPVNMETLVYVLAGFVFSIILVLLLLIVRWRRIDRRNMELARMRGVAAMRGVTRERLDQMEVIKYKKPTPPTSPAADDAGDNNEDICPICLIEFEEDEDVRNLPCKHLFHVACIDEWLSRNTTCPMCKNNLDLAVVDIEIATDAAPPSVTTASQQQPQQQPPQESRGGAIVTPVPDGGEP